MEIKKNIILKKRKIPEINSIKITGEAFKKMNLYASIVSEIIGSDKECMGALINYADKKDNTTRDIYLWDEQNVDYAHADTDYFSLPFNRSKETGLEVVGLWHSHGSIPVFHSSTDERLLKRMYQYINNRVVTNEREIGIEKIIDNEIIRVFEDGSHKELRIKGNIDEIKYIIREEYHVLNSIVINKNSYSENNKNQYSKNDYDAEVLIGLNKSYDKMIEKKVKNAVLEIIYETNNIQLDEKELLKEVGEKVKFHGTYLKDLPNYQRVLDKYEQIKTAKEQNVEMVEQTPNKDSIEQYIEESQLENKKKASLESIIPHAPRTRIEGYHRRMYNLYSAMKNEKNKIVSSIGLIGEILAGDYYDSSKRCWFWEDRIQKAEEMYKNIKRSISKKQHELVGELLEVLNINHYAKKKHNKNINNLCKKLGFKGKVKVKKSKGVFSKILRRLKK